MDAFIVVGPSGSGKTTLAQILTSWLPAHAACLDPAHVEADTYMRENGVYEFSIAKLESAHNQCLRDWLYLVQFTAHPCIVVSNTGTTIAEVAPYLATARAYGWTPVVLLLGADLSEDDLQRRNTHKVPVKTLRRQIYNINRMLGGWPAFWPEIIHLPNDDAVHQYLDVVRPHRPAHQR